MEAERQAQTLGMKLGEQQTKNDKMMALLKELKKNGADPKEVKQLEERIAASDKECSELKRMLELSKKQKASELKKYKAQAEDANKESERLRDKFSGVEEQLKEKELESRVLYLKLKNERRQRKVLKVI